jgi:hypothetical protein
MTFQRKQYQEALDRQKREHVRGNVTQLKQMAQAKVPAEAVTGSAEWDYLLSLIEAKIEELGNSLAVLGEASASDLTFSHEVMAQQKALMMQVKAQKDTLEAVRDLPKQIIEHGEKAQFALQEYTDQ